MWSNCYDKFSLALLAYYTDARALLCAVELSERERERELSSVNEELYYVDL